MSGPRPVTTADAELAVALAASSTAELLRKAYALTHVLHGLPEGAMKTDRRAARDLLTAEILRRGCPDPEGHR